MNVIDAASIAQLAEHALRKRMVAGSIPTGGLSRSRQTRNRAAWLALVQDGLRLRSALAAAAAPASDRGSAK